MGTHLWGADSPTANVCNCANIDLCRTHKPKTAYSARTCFRLKRFRFYGCWFGLTVCGTEANGFWDLVGERKIKKKTQNKTHKYTGNHKQFRNRMRIECPMHQWAWVIRMTQYAKCTWKRFFLFHPQKKVKLCGYRLSITPDTRCMNGVFSFLECDFFDTINSCQYKYKWENSMDINYKHHLFITRSHDPRAHTTSNRFV